MTAPRSPVSPIELYPLSNSDRLPPSSQDPVVPALPSQDPYSTSASQALAAPYHPSSSNARKGSWLPFTLQWYYLIIPIILSLCFGCVIIYLTLHSKQNHGIGSDDGSSAILFGWRFTPTLIAVLYTQMTVILFEDVKRTEPFARLARAPAGGASVYGTLLQTPRAWWAVFIDACFKRNRTGKTSWSLICAALINVIALLAISPLSSALLTSEEVLVPQSINFSRVVPRANVQLPMVPTRDTYYRTMNAVLRNVSTSVWLTDTSLALPFWPSSEAPQFGPNLASPYETWNTDTALLQSKFECQNMTLKSANISSMRYSGVYSQQGYGPLNGTQPMVTFSLESPDNCSYKFSMHPAIDMAARGGVMWSDASTFYPTIDGVLPVGGRLFATNMTSTDIWSRVNASKQCNGRDIIIMSTPWSLPVEGFGTIYRSIPQNYTYQRSKDFRMRALLCDSRYYISKQGITATLSRKSTEVLDLNSTVSENFRELSNSVINIKQYQAKSTQNDWESYFDILSMNVETGQAAASTDAANPGFSGMAPLLAALSRFNISSMLDDPDIARKAASLKGRFFTETLRETFTNPQFVQTDVIPGKAFVSKARVIVLTEIGITLAVLFFSSSLLLIVVLWCSRTANRPLNLRSDPASTVGISLLLNQRLTRSSSINSMHNASRIDLYTALQRERYLTTTTGLLKGDDSTDPPVRIRAKQDWRPRVIHVRMLLMLGFLLTLVLVAVLTLNAFSTRSQLFQLAFVYEADVSKLGLSFSTFAPISIAPTITSVVVGLWWDQLDMALRVLQPFIAMSRGPTPINTGAGLTYRSKTWAGAAFKAGRNKHWVLFMVAVGSVLAQVLTVSMSALFEREVRNVVQQVSSPQTLELRQVPLITEVTLDEVSGSDPRPLASKVVDKLYLDVSNNWLYGAGIQHSYNGSQLPWTAGGWSFLPIDLSNNILGNPETNPVNLTLNTSAIRARLDCRVIEEMRNISSWIKPIDPTSKNGKYSPEELIQINGTGKAESYELKTRIFAGTDSHTTIHTYDTDVVCCGNGTRANPQQAIMGYWSPVYPPGPSLLLDRFPYQTLSWPLSIVPKWIAGNPFNLTTSSSTKSLLFNGIPQLQAAHCEPIIESAKARVTLMRNTGNVISHKIEGPATTADVAWEDVFTRHESRSKASLNKTSLRSLNITSSFGVLFLDSLLGAANRGGKENAFTFQDADNGMAMDIMTYSMYVLANRNSRALLDYSTLVATADQTFQTFFQHFVNSGLSLINGGLAYQSINDSSMDGLGRSVDNNGTRIAEKSFPVLNTNRTIEVSISHRIRVLHMNTTATYLSTAIIVWLILTTLIVVSIQRQYTRFMNRDVQFIADMLVLVAGSDNFLDLDQEKGVKLKKNKDIKTMLGWFKDRNGEVRWGVEVVGGRNAVQWVDAPKNGFHTPINISKSKANWIAWRPWRQ